MVFLSCNNIHITDKVVYYRIDTNYYKLHPDKQPEVNFITLNNIFDDLTKTGKELNVYQVNMLKKMLNSSSNHIDRDCGTIWKDGMFIIYNSKGDIEKYVVVSLDCYDIIVHDQNEKQKRISLNESGQSILFELIN